MQLGNAVTNSIILNFPKEKHPDLHSFLSSFDFLDFPGSHNYPASFDSEYSKAVIDSFIQNFSECLFIDNPINFDLLSPAGSPSTKDLAALEVFNREQVNKIDSYTVTSPLEVILNFLKNKPTWKELNATEILNWRQEKFSSSQWKFISARSSFRGNSLYCAPHQTELHPIGFNSILLPTHPYQETITNRNQSVMTGNLPSIQLSQPETAPNSYIPNKPENDIPSFNAITDALQDPPPHQMTGYQTTTYSLPGSSSLILKPGSQSYPRFSNPNSPFLYSNSPLRPFNINSRQPEYRFGTPLNDPGLFKLMEDFEADCKRNEIEAGKKKIFQNFSSAKVVHHANNMQFQQFIFSSPVQTEFFKTMTAALLVLDSSQRIFQVNEVWVDQKTISLRPGCWMNPHSLDCYLKMLNMDQLIRGRQGLIPSSDVIRHIVPREDMEILMRPLLNHSDPICRDILSEARVGFSLQIANFVHLPCFNDKQWILITTNLESGRFFDIMNPVGSGNDKFTTIISTVSYNFKSLFALTYLNCTAFNIKDFDYRFLTVPRTHFRYETSVFLLQILKTYRGMGVLGGFASYARNILV